MIHLLIVDDHAAMRHGLRLLFDMLDDVVVVAEAADGDEALRAIHRGGLSLAVLDLSMPGLSGVELIERIRGLDSQLPIVVLSMHSEPQVAQRALAAGALAYLVKGCDSEEIVDTVRRLAAAQPNSRSAMSECFLEPAGCVQPANESEPRADAQAASGAFRETRRVFGEE